jgi:hypothetical protein
LCGHVSGADKNVSLFNDHLIKYDFMCIVLFGHRLILLLLSQIFSHHLITSCLCIHFLSSPLQALDPDAAPNLPDNLFIETEPEISEPIEFVALNDSSKENAVNPKKEIDITPQDDAITDSVDTDNVQTEIKEETSENDTENPPSTVARNSSQYTCGNCRGSISEDEWDAHLGYHNGLAWQLGIDSIIDLTDQSEVINQIKRYMRKNNVTILTCEKCSSKKRSAYGKFILHRSV